jgi:hypothetical protein
MGCFIAIIALMLPRVALVLVFLLTPWLAVAFDHWLWPLLGLVFAPYTTLAWTATALNTGGDITLGWGILLAVAALADVGHWGGGYKSHRRRVVVRRR